MSDPLFDVPAVTAPGTVPGSVPGSVAGSVPAMLQDLQRVDCQPMADIADLGA
jgi:hypothetical protein